VWNINSSLVSELRQKAYRAAYVISHIRIGIPFQIRSLRMQRGWNQEEFAKQLGMSQPRISEMERPGARRPNIETLLRIAEALDVALQVRFVPFSELVEWSESFNPDAFSVPSFDDEIAQQKNTNEVVQTVISANNMAEYQPWLDMQSHIKTQQSDLNVTTPQSTSTEIALLDGAFSTPMTTSVSKTTYENIDAVIGRGFSQQGEIYAGRNIGETIIPLSSHIIHSDKDNVYS
jgi:transcriptional regulator with XRE-family HTH domain